MYKFLTKNGQTIAFGLGVLVTILFLVGVLPNIEEFSNLPEEEQAETGIFNFGLMGAILFTIIAAVAMVFFGVFHVATDFKGSIKGIIGFVILLAIFFIAYSVASGEATPYIEGAIDKFNAGGRELTANNLKFISAGIFTALVMVGIAALAFVVSELTNLFK